MPGILPTGNPGEFGKFGSNPDFPQLSYPEKLSQQPDEKFRAGSMRGVDQTWEQLKRDREELASRVANSERRYPCFGCKKLITEAENETHNCLDDPKFKLVSPESLARDPDFAGGNCPACHQNFGSLQGVSDHINTRIHVRRSK